MEMKERLAHFREEKGFNKKEVADGAKIPYTTYIKYEYGEREIGISALQKLADFYGVTTDYLLGRQEPDNQDPIDIIAKKYRLTSAQRGIVAAYLYMDEDDRENLLNIVKRLAEGAKTPEEKMVVSRLFRKHMNKASAGYGYDLDNERIWETIRIKDVPEADESDFIVEVDGDSMEPNYHDGDLVFIKLSPEVPIGSVGLFRKGGCGYIKRCGEDHLISDNPDYDDIYPDDGGDNIECIGLVLGIADKIE
ncbi:LexA family transcriptional regulator [uncultured Ruminococcus sp.]|uniref:XRE family transcriptional regulator n=1 Tax=uncultured Ruminococcus sp. TaxID=165186 RepID=UPI0026169F6E|nr:LexA family transcriptional regulator [uncultured Ruminococcus sp.]